MSTATTKKRCLEALSKLDPWISSNTRKPSHTTPPWCFSSCWTQSSGTDPLQGEKHRKSTCKGCGHQVCSTFHTTTHKSKIKYYRCLVVGGNIFLYVTVQNPYPGYCAVFENPGSSQSKVIIPHEHLAHRGLACAWKKNNCN